MKMHNRQIITVVSLNPNQPTGKDIATCRIASNKSISLEVKAANQRIFIANKVLKSSQLTKELAGVLKSNMAANHATIFTAVGDNQQSLFSLKRAYFALAQLCLEKAEGALTVECIQLRDNCIFNILKNMPIKNIQDLSQNPIKLTNKKLIQVFSQVQRRVAKISYSSVVLFKLAGNVQVVLSQIFCHRYESFPLQKPANVLGLFKISCQSQTQFIKKYLQLFSLQVLVTSISQHPVDVSRTLSLLSLVGKNYRAQFSLPRSTSKQLNNNCQIIPMQQLKVSRSQLVIPFSERYCKAVQRMEERDISNFKLRRQTFRFSKKIVKMGENYQDLEQEVVSLREQLNNMRNKLAQTSEQASRMIRQHGEEMQGLRGQASFLEQKANTLRKVLERLVGAEQLNRLVKQ